MANERPSIEPAEPARTRASSPPKDDELPEPRAHLKLTKIGAMKLLASMVAPPRKHAGLRRLVVVSEKYRKRKA
jgi:hypothetical protein